MVHAPMTLNLREPIFNMDNAKTVQVLFIRVNQVVGKLTIVSGV